MTTLKKQLLKVQTIIEMITRSKILSQSANSNEHEDVCLNQIFSLQTQSFLINQAAKNKSFFEIQ